jgi:hypothetical protein
MAQAEDAISDKWNRVHADRPSGKAGQGPARIGAVWRPASRRRLGSIPQYVTKVALRCSISTPEFGRPQP